MTFFSIVIPVYNGVHNDLPVCLESIWSQPLDNDLFEVICVDDCSTDDTREYLIQEQKKHNNLKIILNHENLRQGGAKNKGIQIASGEYILFIDQDDYYHPSSLKLCYELLHDNRSLEILCCDSSWQQKGKESNTLQLNYPCQNVLTGHEFVKKNGFALAPWRMVCRRDYLLKNSLFFQEKVRIEDIDWGCRLVVQAERIRYMPILLVHYNRYEAQTTGMMKYNFSILQDQMFAAYRIFEFAKNLTMPFVPLENMWKHHYRVSLRMMLGCFAPVKKKSSCIRKYCQSFQNEDSLIHWCYRHAAIYGVLSNMAIPFYRLGMKILTSFRWMCRK